eukprot:Nk52_evm11s376 gene=Nk52_evmTU11s376
MMGLRMRRCAVQNGLGVSRGRVLGSVTGLLKRHEQKGLIGSVFSASRGQALNGTLGVNRLFHRGAVMGFHSDGVHREGGNKTSSYGTSLFGRHQFDTNKVVKDLEHNGFTPQQAEAMQRVINGVLQESLAEVRDLTVTNAKFEEFLFKQEAALDSLKKDMQILEKSEFNLLKYETENVKSGLKILNDQLRDEVAKLKAGVRLDLSLEKSRVSEMSTLHNQAVKDTKNKIDTEIAGVKTLLESIKLESLRFTLEAFSCDSLVRFEE